MGLQAWESTCFFYFHATEEKNNRLFQKLWHDTTDQAACILWLGE